MATTRLYVTDPGWEQALLAELEVVLPTSRHRALAPGWVMTEPSKRDRAAYPALAFSRQCVPEATLVPAPSISLAAKGVVPEIIETLGSHEGPIRLHVPLVELTGGPVRGGRASLIKDTIRSVLKAERRRLFRALSRDEAAPFAPDEALVQVALVTPAEAWLSILGPGDIARLGPALSRFEGGHVALEDDPRPPARAYKKLVEALTRMDATIEPGATVVDLGASPGSWTFVALETGARVTAVDRSPLRDDLMAHERCTFVKGDAFKYLPEAKADWLLSDVIAYPERVVELLDIWLGGHLAERLVVTVKFKGDDRLGAIDEIRRRLAHHGADCMVQHLEANKNEVTIYGRARWH